MQVKMRRICKYMGTLVIYDIDECLQGTSCQVRLDSDQKQVISVLFSLMPDSYL